MEAFNECQGGWGAYGFSAAQTGQPFGAGGVTLATTNGSPGLGYASFLLGLPNSVTVIPCTSVNWHDRGLAAYAQDNWKVTRKFTLDLGLRYDLQVPPLEDRNRISSFSPTLPNPSAGNLPGAVLYQGFGPDTCNCGNLLNLYKFAFGPRLGAAYQLDPKTAAGSGWGFFYGAPSTFSPPAPRRLRAGNGLRHHHVFGNRWRCLRASERAAGGLASQPLSVCSNPALARSAPHRESGHRSQ